MFLAFFLASAVPLVFVYSDFDLVRHTTTAQGQWLDSCNTSATIHSVQHTCIHTPSRVQLTFGSSLNVLKGYERRKATYLIITEEGGTLLHKKGAQLTLVSADRIVIKRLCKLENCSGLRVVMKENRSRTREALGDVGEERTHTFKPTCRYGS